MRILELNRKQLEYFKEEDPFEFRLKDNVVISLMHGAVFEPEDETGSGNLPIGLLLGTRKEDNLILIWLYVDPECRRQGIGEALLASAFEEAKKNGCRNVAAVFPEEYGRELICRTEKEYFEAHGFHEKTKGLMTMALKDYEKEVSYGGPSFLDEAFALDELLREDPEEDDTAPGEDYDDREFFVRTHKDWYTKRLSLKEFAYNKKLHRAGKFILKGEAPVKVGTISELTLSQYKQVLNLCMENGHSGFPEELFDIPADYFDLEISSYVQEDTDGDNDYDDEIVCGVCLIHYNRREQALYVELLYALGKNYARSLGEMVRCSLMEAVKKYPEDTTVVLPCDERLHGPIMDKLFEELRAEKP